MPTGLPDFLIIGAQKSGTTSLLRILSAHPELQLPPRQISFFDRNFERGVDWYREQLDSPAPRRMIGEKTAEYLFDPDVPARIAALLPQVKTIAILRDPVTRAYSHYWHNRSRGQEELSFEGALAAETERLRRDAYHHATYSYVARGRYHEQLSRFTALLPRASMLVLLLDDLRTRPQETIMQTLTFLGARPEVLPANLGTPRNRHVTFRSQWLRGPIQRLPMPLRRLAVRLNSREVPYEPMNPTTRKRLRAEFAGNNAALGTWLERDLSEW